MTLNGTKRRWTEDSGRLAAEVVSRLQRGGRLTDLGLGEIDGCVDLRGLSTRASTRRATRVAGVTRAPDRPTFMSLPIVRRLRFASLDLSGAILPGWLLQNVEIRDCRLDGADLRDWAVFDGSVTRTTFRGADLRGMLIGNKTTYRECSFERADLRDAVTVKVSFEDVDFGWANLDEVEFPDSQFVRCLFRGRMYGTIFGGKGTSGALDGNDLAEVETVLVEFRALDLRDVVPPEHPDVIVIENFREVLDALEREIDADRGHQMAWLETSREAWRGWLGANQRIGIIHREELTPSGVPEDADVAIAILRRLEREVRG